MRVQLVSLKRSFVNEEAVIRKILKTLGELLKLSDSYMEVYLVGENFNIHSFPAVKNFPRPDVSGKRDLGELYVNPAYIKKHGEDLALILTHGLLHLLGYDHRKKSDRIKMEEKERQLREQLQ
jgi:rRNA maturation RNase YbeY